MQKAGGKLESNSREHQQSKKSHSKKLTGNKGGDMQREKEKDASK